MNPVHTAAKYSCLDVFGTALDRLTPFRTELRNTHATKSASCSTEIWKFSSSLCAFFLHLWTAMCYLQIVPNSFSQMENAFFKVPFAAKTSILYEIRNNKSINRRYTTLLQQIQRSYMFRLHKAAIIRSYVLENVKNKYLACSSLILSRPD